MPNILLVEDDPSIARMLIRILSLGGNYQVQHAEDGKAGLDLASSADFDLILLDIMMPGLNGMEVLEALKNDQKLRDIPVVMMTNLGSEQNAHTALEKGAAGYVVKSDVDPEEILATVKRFLRPPVTSPN